MDRIKATCTTILGGAFLLVLGTRIQPAWATALINAVSSAAPPCTATVISSAISPEGHGLLRYQKMFAWVVLPWRPQLLMELC